MLHAGLADGHAHAGEVSGQAVVGLQRAKTVERHLRVLLGVDLDPTAILEVNDDQLFATGDDHVGGAPGGFLGHVQVAGVVDADVSEQHAVVAAQVQAVVDAHLDVLGHLFVDLEGVLGSRRIAGLAPRIETHLAADVGAGRALFLQRPGQHLVRSGALGGVAVGVVRCAVLEHDLAGAKHQALELAGGPVAVGGGHQAASSSASLSLTAARAAPHWSAGSSLNVFTPKPAATAAAASRLLPARANTAF